MFELEPRAFFAVAREECEEDIGSLRQRKVDGRLPQAKVQQPLLGPGVIDPDELVDDTCPDSKQSMKARALRPGFSRRTMKYAIGSAATRRKNCRFSFSKRVVAFS